MNIDIKDLEYLENSNISIKEIKNYLHQIINHNTNNNFLFHITDIICDEFGEIIICYNVRFGETRLQKSHKCHINTFSKPVRNNISLIDACEIIFNALKNDKDYYHSWQSNIAMSILDTKRWFLEEHDLKKVPKELEQSLANKAAKHFLNILTDDRKG